MKKILSISIVLLILVSSCGPQKQLVTKRFQSFNTSTIPKGKIPENYVSVEAFSYPTAPTVKKKTIFDLSERGQKELISAASKKKVTTELLHQKLAIPISPKKSPKKLIDKTYIERTIVFSVENENNITGANRIQRIEVMISRMAEDAFQFISWDKLSTEFGSINLGKISASDSSTFTFNPEISLSGTIKGSLGGGFSNTRTVAEEKDLSKRNLSLSGALSPNKVKIIREGAESIDLEGNTVLKLKIKTPPGSEFTFTSFSDLTKKNPKIARTTYILPQIDQNGIKASLKYNFVYREVLMKSTDNSIDANNKGIYTIIEGDDRVNLIQGNNISGQNFTILRKEDLELFSWNIFYEKKEKKATLALKDTLLPLDLQFEVINLTSYDNTLTFLRWLKKKSLEKKPIYTIANYELVLLDENLKEIKLTTLLIDDLLIDVNNIYDP